ncbi:excisionase family DNA-binding protein [Enterobacter roggenkampii]|uniref:excisionase family DNA-binding protein n=1 Tax=Enterobacter roggenkampii TaxID=1812935 RepID=UPI00200528CF|nr:helix-turn-helix domain-containing protein [Enterobacter roggenkampii]MCK6873123.1 helix-turn-helix domain-containing protein [Enterobacter roggenkampii]
MEKLTLTRKEAAELLGISIATVTQWVQEGRLKAYRVSDRPKSPYLFTREDCQAAISAVQVQSRAERHLSPAASTYEPTALKHEKLDRELKELLKTRTKGRTKE